MWDLQADAKKRLGTPHRVTEFVEAGEYTASITADDHSADVTITVLDEPGRSDASRRPLLRNDAP